VTDPDTPVPFEPPELFCRHLLVCRTIWYDAGNPDDGYSLGRVVIHVHPPEDHEYGYLEPRLFGYAQLFGTPDEYTCRVRLVRIQEDETADEIPSEPQIAEWGPWDIAVTGDSFVEAFGFQLVRVPFDAPGVYEFQLWVDGFEEPIGRERVEAQE
jgi:hypothetical protein